MAEFFGEQFTAKVSSIDNEQLVLLGEKNQTEPSKNKMQQPSNSSNDDEVCVTVQN